MELGIGIQRQFTVSPPSIIARWRHRTLIIENYWTMNTHKDEVIQGRSHLRSKSLAIQAPVLKITSTIALWNYYGISCCQLTTSESSGVQLRQRIYLDTLARRQPALSVRRYRKFWSLNWRSGAGETTTTTAERWWLDYLFNQDYNRFKSRLQIVKRKPEHELMWCPISDRSDTRPAGAAAAAAVTMMLMTRTMTLRDESLEYSSH